MKKLHGLFLSFLFLLVSACSEEDNRGPNRLELSKNKLVFHLSGGQKAVTLDTNADRCEVIVPEEAISWCSASVMQEGSLRTVRVTVTANPLQKNRQTVLTVAAGNRKENLEVEQLGSDPQILFAVSSFKTGFLSSVLDIEVISNVVYKVQSGQKWISEIPDSARSMDTEVRKFRIEQNSKSESRDGSIDFKQVDGDVSGRVSVIQLGMAAGEGADEVRGDSLIRVIRAEASSFQPGAEIEKAVDGDLNTIYHSNWSNSGQNYFPITLTFCFDGSDRIDYLTYSPRPSGSNGNLRQFELQVQRKNEAGFVKYGEYDFKGSGSDSRISFEPGGLQEVAAIRFVVKSGAGDGQGFVSCGEMQFRKKVRYENSVFTDALCSALRPGITAADIDTMSNVFFKNIAGLMLVGQYDTVFRVQEYRAWQHPDIQAGTHKTSPYSLLDNPTGISVRSDEEVVLLAGDLHHQRVYLHVQDLEAGYGGPGYLLNEGINKIKVSGKGLLYIRYHTDTGLEAPVKIHIASGRVNGYYDVRKHAPSQWRTLLGNAVDPHFDILGEYTHMTFPVAKLKTHTPDGDDLIRTADEIVRLEQEFMGLYKYSKAFSNRLYMHVVYDDSYMYATSYRTAYHEGTLSDLAVPRKLRTSAVWGPAHEIGHCNQTRPGFKWVGMTEVTNNVMSMYVQRKLAHDSRLQSESLQGDGYENRYNKAFNTTIVAGIPSGMEGDVFCKLVPLWQLYLYVTEVVGNAGFYPDIYEMIRQQSNPLSQGEYQLNFVRLACKSARLDLTGFFTLWGYLTPIDEAIDDYGVQQLTVTEEMIRALKAEIAAEGYPVPGHSLQYITDNTVELYRAGRPVVAGTAQLSGNTVTLVGWQNVVAVESYDDAGALKAVTTGVSARTHGGPVYAVGAGGDKVAVSF